MALVILSEGMLSHSRVRTIHIRTLLAALGALILVVCIAAFAAGYQLAQGQEGPAALAGAAPPSVLHEVVAGRVGELSGRLMQLESEAVALANRVGALKDFEARVGNKLQKLPDPGVRKPRAESLGLQPSSGGPLIPVVGGSAAPSAQISRDSLDVLEADLERVSAALEEISAEAEARNLSYMAFPSRMPVRSGERSSGFGNRSDPFTGQHAFHSGMDFNAPVGTPVHAAAGGRVSVAARHPEYGLMVELDHGNGLVTRYAHLSKTAVLEGEVVMPGQRIGAMGSTGRSTGPHLHFEVIEDGRFVNPANYLVGLR